MIWKSKKAEELNCFTELHNAIDAYAIKAVANNGITVRNFPQEMPRVSELLLDLEQNLTLFHCSFVN